MACPSISAEVQTKRYLTSIGEHDSGEEAAVWFEHGGGEGDIAVDGEVADDESLGGYRLQLGDNHPPPNPVPHFHSLRGWTSRKTCFLLRFNVYIATY